MIALFAPLPPLLSGTSAGRCLRGGTREQQTAFLFFFFFSLVSNPSITAPLSSEIPWQRGACVEGQRSMLLFCSQPLQPLEASNRQREEGGVSGGGQHSSVLVCIYFPAHNIYSVAPAKEDVNGPNCFHCTVQCCLTLQQQRSPMDQTSQPNQPKQVALLPRTAAHARCQGSGGKDSLRGDPVSLVVAFLSSRKQTKNNQALVQRHFIHCQLLSL